VIPGTSGQEPVLKSLDILTIKKNKNPSVNEIIFSLIAVFIASHVVKSFTGSIPSDYEWEWLAAG